MDPIHRLPPITPGLRSSGVDLWCFSHERAQDPGLFREFAALMTQDERARHDRLRFERDRRMFLATRALVRTVLSSYANVEPADWRFGEGERGKPHVTGPPGVPPLYFNLSNTRGLVVCAVSGTYPEIGADVESLDRPGGNLGVADRFFSPFEVAALRALPTEQQRTRFFRYWTLKESYIKARGLGLALPLDRFSFLLDDGPTIRITFDPRLEDDPARWRFVQFSSSPGHLVAVGVATGGSPLSVCAAHFVPLRGVVPFEEAGTAGSVAPS